MTITEAVNILSKCPGDLKVAEAIVFLAEAAKDRDHWKERALVAESKVSNFVDI